MVAIVASADGSLKTSATSCAADVSHQAYCLLRSYLQRFPYARLESQDGGTYAGMPFVVFDTAAAWQPLAALRLVMRGRAELALPVRDQVVGQRTLPCMSGEQPGS